MSQDNNDKSPFGGSNSGNHWPWSFSLFGGALILLLLSFAVYRHYTLGAPVGFDDPLEQPAAPIDTSKANEATQMQ